MCDRCRKQTAAASHVWSCHMTPAKLLEAQTELYCSVLRVSEEPIHKRKHGRGFLTLRVKNFKTFCNRVARVCARQGTWIFGNWKRRAGGSSERKLFKTSGDGIVFQNTLVSEDWPNFWKHLLSVIPSLLCSGDTDWSLVCGASSPRSCQLYTSEQHQS